MTSIELLVMFTPPALPSALAPTILNAPLKPFVDTPSNTTLFAVISIASTLPWPRVITES